MEGRLTFFLLLSALFWKEKESLARVNFHDCLSLQEKLVQARGHF